MCDHKNDDEVKALFKKINEEQSGRLDILVNNAFSVARVSTDIMLLSHIRIQCANIHECTLEATDSL